MVSDQWTTQIKARPKFWELNFKEVYAYKDLIFMFVKRYFTLSYKQTILGPFWLLIKPVLSAVMYTIVFTGIAHISTEGAPAILFYMLGNAMWTFFSSCLTGNAGTFTDNAGIFGKVYFPRLVMPISNVIVNIINLFIQGVLITVVAVVCLIKGQIVHPNMAVLLLPVLILQAGMLGMGCGIIVSSATTKYRDLSVLVGFGMQLWMYATPVVYPMSQIPHKFQILILLNPCTPIMETTRYALLGTGQIPVASLIGSMIFSVVIFMFGTLLFNKVEKTFMDFV